MNIFKSLTFAEGERIEKTILLTMDIWYERVSKTYPDPDAAREITIAVLDIIYVVTTRAVAESIEGVEPKERPETPRWREAIQVVGMHITDFWETVDSWSRMAIDLGLKKETLPDFVN